MHEMFEKISEALKELDSDQPEIRKKAAVKLREYKHSDVSHLLEKLIKNENKHPLTRISAIQSLAWFKEKSHLKLLIDLALDDANKLVRLSAIEEVASLKDQGAVEPLMKLVNRSSDEQIIKAASVAIQVIQGLTPEWSLDNS
ncbi:MAG: HEAT repeat domain-containing protein [Candidatus Hodarchaeales archaeon]|jgi:HEAT repeat protein